MTMTVQKFPAEYFDSVTAFLRSTAVGLWNNDDAVNRDEVVTFGGFKLIVLDPFTIAGASIVVGQVLCPSE
jgi:hypothetical protein